MNLASGPEVAVPEPLTDGRVRRRQKPFRRQRHDENASGTNRSADYDHSVGGKSLSQRADNWRQNNDHPRIDRRQFSNRSMQPHFAIAEFRKDIIHLQENRLEKTNEEK